MIDLKSTLYLSKIIFASSKHINLTIEMGLFFVCRTRSPCLAAQSCSADIKYVNICLRSLRSFLYLVAPRDRSVISKSMEGVAEALPAMKREENKNQQIYISMSNSNFAYTK